MLRVFCKNVNLRNTEIIGVEMPLSARLYNEKAQPMNINLIGVIDALVKIDDGSIIAIDHKTALKPKQQADVDTDLQFSSYAYLLSSNRIVGKSDDVRCRMDVLRKLKNPKLELYNTVRTSADRIHFAKVATGVLKGIEHQAFFPNRSWMCSGCEYTQACKNW